MRNELTSQKEMFQQACDLCRLTLRALAIQIAAADRRMAERRHEIQFCTLRDPKAGW